MLVIRDGEGRPIARVLNETDMNPRQSWRAQIRAVTNNGTDLLMRVYDIAMGKPITVTLPDGRELEPMVASPEVQARYALHLHELLNGKAVSQTEVLEAEKAMSAVEDVRNMSLEQLEHYAFLERSKPATPALPPPAPSQSVEPTKQPTNSLLAKLKGLK